MGFLKPKTPKMPDPVRLPNQNDADVKIGRKIAVIEEQRKRKGRRSTDLTSSSPSYSRTTLG